jgi:hypothetical protein
VLAIVVVGLVLMGPWKRDRVDAGDTRVVNIPPGGSAVVDTHTGNVTAPNGTTTTVPPPAVVTTTSPTVVTTQPTITETRVVYTASSQPAWAGRRAEVKNARVLNVVGDRTFWVGEDESQKLFVRLDRSLDAGYMEKVVRMKPGQLVNLSGYLRAAPADSPSWWRHRYSHGDTDMGEQLYLHTDSIEFLAR